MADSEFATAILTSKSPEEVAAHVPHLLALSSQLIEKDLVTWFSNYVNMILKYNHDLNALVANGRNIFANKGGEFGSIDKIWNCVALCVMSQIQVNDLLAKVIRHDVIGQFTAAFKSDYKYLELLVNADELAEMLRGVHGQNGAYNWNVKAPAILANFENYKRYEKDLLFSAFLAYLNTVNSKTASLLNKNENAVNFILKEFSVDAEMDAYKDHLLASAAPPPTAAHRDSAAAHPAPPHAPLRSSGASVMSASSETPSAKKEKRKSRLRLRVGSILGRKKKDKLVLHADAIPEDTLVSLVPLRTATSTRNSLYTAQLGNAAPKPAPADDRHERSTARLPQRPVELDAAEPVPEIAHKEPAPAPPRGFHLLVSANDPALQPVQASVAMPDLPERATDEEPNLVKYSLSDDDSDVPTDAQGNRMLMLQAHSLDQPPRLDTDLDARSRNTSSGKYSFEYGDEEKPISASNTPRRTDAPVFPSVGDADHPAPNVDESPKAVQPQVADHVEPETASAAPAMPAAPAVVPGAFATRAPPPPPPSRKLHATETRVGSQTFHNLHSARESFVAPHADGISLVSQTTGNSLFRQDYFKHFGSTDVLTQEGLNTSVAELLNVKFVNGEVQKAQVLGEIAFNYNSTEPVDSLAVRIPTKFSRFLLNEQFMEQKGSDLFALRVPAITGKTLGGIKYLIDLGAALVPLLVKQVWKFEPHQASLIIKLSLNSSYGQSVRLENLTVSAALDSSVGSTSASSKPEGSFNKDLNRITWRFTQPVVLGPEKTEEKLIARIMTSGQAKESASGVQVRFAVSQPPASNVDIRDADGAAIASVRSLSSGNYSSHT